MIEDRDEIDTDLQWAAVTRKLNGRIRDLRAALSEIATATSGGAAYNIALNALDEDEQERP